jgi:branched-chain amino acid transport system substrate-binding protein
MRRGGINGKKIEVVLLDDECKPDKGIANVNRFIHQHKVHLVMGSTCSSVTMPMVDVTAKEEVPQIVPHSTNANITKKGSPWVFRTSVSERFYASVHAKYLSEKVGKKVAYLSRRTAPASASPRTTCPSWRRPTRRSRCTRRRCRRRISISARIC